MKYGKNYLDNFHLILKGDLLSSTSCMVILLKNKPVIIQSTTLGIEHANTWCLWGAWAPGNLQEKYYDNSIVRNIVKGDLALVEVWRIFRWQGHMAFWVTLMHCVLCHDTHCWSNIRQSHVFVQKTGFCHPWSAGMTFMGVRTQGTESSKFLLKPGQRFLKFRN